jgi:hypothetical protein
MFYELIVRIASVKFKESGNAQTGFILMPSKCFELFVNDLMIPWLQRTRKWDHNVQGADLFIANEVLTNKQVLRLMF